MESNSYSTCLRISGNLSADCTLLITDIFQLFPSSFEKLVPMLEKQYRVIYYSDNGFDAFNRPQQLKHDTFQGYADDLIKSLQEKKIEGITYLAHSVNALVAFYAAGKEPGLFDKIILLSAVPCFRKNAARQYQCGFDTGIVIDHLFEQLSNEPDKSDKPEQLQGLLASSFSNMNNEKAGLIFNLIISDDCCDQLHKLTMPVMIIQGTQDKIATNEATFFMHRRIPESYIVKIRSKGHLPQLQAPEEVLRAIEIFMHPVAC